MNFNKAVMIILDFEGGFVNHPDDPGGVTKYGISQRAFPKVNIRELKRNEAKAIYKAHYWDPCRCDELPAGIRLMVFDCAVNQGVSVAIKLLQEACGAKIDGVLGPKTLAAAHAATANSLLANFSVKRFNRYAKNKNWGTFGKGWGRRLLEVTSLSQLLVDNEDVV